MPLKPRYFIILYNQDHTNIIPMMEDEENIALFDSIHEAREAAKEQIIAKTYGYDIFKIFLDLE